MDAPQVRPGERVRLHGETRIRRVATVLDQLTLDGECVQVAYVPGRGYHPVTELEIIGDE